MLALLLALLSVLGPRSSSAKTFISSPTSKKPVPAYLQRSKSLLARSIQKFKAKASSMSTTSVDEISFSSPMPSELCSPMGSDFSNLEQWDPLNGGDPFGPSPMELGQALDFAPNRPIPLRSQALPTQFGSNSTSTLSKSCSRESISNSDPHDSTCNPTAPDHSIDVLVQCSTASSHKNLFSSSSASLVTWQPSPSSPLARSRSHKLLSGPQTYHRKFSSRRLSSSFSLQDLKSNSSNKYHTRTLSPSSPSSFAGHQPGLEYRVIRRLKHSRSRSHVPIGTPEF